jgi:hypothetical protein
MDTIVTDFQQTPGHLSVVEALGSKAFVKSAVHDPETERAVSRLRITIAGRDRAQDLQPALNTEAEKAFARSGRAHYPPELLATSLCGCRNEREFLDRLLVLTRRKSHVDTSHFDSTRRPGIAGMVWASIRQKLWRLLRYQHERVFFRQNMVNSQFVSAVEFERDLLLSEITRLEERLDRLERRQTAAPFSQ